MKMKNKILIIGLIMLILLSMTCVSASQDINDNSTLETDVSNIEEVTSSNTGEMEVHSTETELEKDNDVLEADDGDTIGEQAINDDTNLAYDDQSINDDVQTVDDEPVISKDVLGSDSGSISQQAESDIGASNELLGISNDDNEVLQYTKYLHYDQLPNFSGISFVVSWYQKNLNKDGIYLIFTNEGLKLITSLGEPLTLEGGNNLPVNVNYILTLDLMVSELYLMVWESLHW